jgi:hypothetical protein
MAFAPGTKPVHVVYRDRPPARDTRLVHSRERAAYVERLARAHADRWGLPLKIAVKHVEQISVRLRREEENAERLRSAGPRYG